MKKLVLTAFSLATVLALACSADQEPSAAGLDATAPPSATASSPAGPTPVGESSFVPLAGDWITDFSISSVRNAELTRGQTKDGIPSIDNPQFLPVAETDFLGEREPVIAFVSGEDARAYPLQIMMWHEIVNDVVGDEPVLITFCPLCNTAIAFDRVVDGQTLEFGVSGFLRNSDLVMYDRTTESFWQQITGEALIGTYTGTSLTPLPASIVSWADFREGFPDGKVLSRDTGFSKSYGVNPYTGYDDIDSSPFLFFGDTDGRLSAMERVVTVELGPEVVAYPFSRLEAVRVANDTVDGRNIVVFFEPGTASALDLRSIAESRDIGSATAFDATIDGQLLTFEAADEGFVDAETGSTWDIFGRAIAGSLEGKNLEPIVSGNHFWFAWAAFQPDTRVWQPA